MTAITMAGLSVRTPHAVMLRELASSPVYWFPENTDNGDDIEHADV